MDRIQEIYVLLDDKPGSYAQLTRILKKKRISIYGVGLFLDSARLHVSHPEKAFTAITENGFEAELHDVLCVRLPNREGAMAELTQKLANANINILYLYGALEEKQKRGTIVLEVDDMNLAMNIFKNHHFA